MENHWVHKDAVIVSGIVSENFDTRTSRRPASRNVFGFFIVTVFLMISILLCLYFFQAEFSVKLSVNEKSLLRHYD